jgi:ribonuclease E
MAARGETEGFAWEEPEARTAQPPTEGHAEPEAAASVMHEALSTETAIEVEPEPATEVEPVPESAAAEAEEPEQLAEEERTILSPIVEPELLVVGEPLAPPGHDVPEPEAAHTEEQEETAGARPEAAPEVQLEARADETVAEPEPEVAVLLDADDAPEDPRAVPIGMPESQRAVEEAPTPVEEEPGEPVAANKPARRARKKPVKARPKRAASKAKERVPPAQPKPSRRRPPRDPPG